MTEFRVLRQCCRWLCTSLFCQLLFLLPWVTPLLGQSQTTLAAASEFPHLVKFSGSVKDAAGKPLTGTVGLIFALYKEEQGGSPLWLENQNVQADVNGHYTAFLGASNSAGLPQELFVSGEARWLGVRVDGEGEQPRVLLLSVPYALKAGDAATFGGLPPSAFMLAYPDKGNSSSPNNSSGNVSGQPNVSGSGTQNYIPLWTDNNGTLGNSSVYQSGSGNSAQVGINTSTPAAALDVNGSTIARGPLQLPSTGTANSSQGFTSQPLSLQGSAFNSNTQKAVGPLFQWQTEPVGNNTSSPSGSLNLLYGSGSGSPGETGLNIANNGIINFVKTQTFPNTLTGITAGTGISVAGSKTNPTVGINVTFANQNFANLNNANTFTKNQTVNGTMTATNFSGNGSGLTNVNAAELGGLPPSAYQPAGSYATTGANSFTGNQSVTGNVSATGAVTGNTATFTGLLTVNGALLPASGTAGASQGYNSQPLDAETSVFNSSTQQATNQDFRWQAEPVGNNSSAPSGKLNLLFGANGGNPSETGLSVASNGNITFSSGQTFPGTGTITGVTAGSGMAGGGTSGNVTLGLTNSCASGQVLQWNGTTWVCITIGGGGTITGVTAGTDLTGGGNSGTVTLNLDTTKVPQLNTANTFTGTQTVNGNFNATGSVNSGSYQLGGTIFAYGNYTNQNAYLGFAGSGASTGGDNTAIGTFALLFNSSGSFNVANGSGALSNNTTGSDNMASGSGSLGFNTTGSANTASGDSALSSNTTGGNNTAVGQGALFSNNTGSFNTALGYSAGTDPSATNLTNATAIGAFADVTANNSLVLGSISGVNGATANAKVGIGTTAPAATLDVHGNANFTGAITFAPGQTFPGTGTITGITAGTDLVGGGTSGSVTLGVDTTKVVTGITAGTDLTGGGNGGVQTLNLDTTKVPQLNAANTFTGNQTVNGNLTTAGVVSSTGYQIGGNLFAFGNYGLASSYLGFSGNTSITGFDNTADGPFALGFDTTGSSDVAVGYEALFSNTTGGGNTGIGAWALNANTTGNNNTASGLLALWNNFGGSGNTADGYLTLSNNTIGSNNTAVGFVSLASSGSGSNLTCLGALCNVGTGGLNNATAIGASAEVSQSNSMVLGSINGVNNATADTSVGIGTTAPSSTLDVEATAPGLVGPVFLLKNKAPVQSGTFGNSVDLRFALDGGSSVGNANAYIRAAEDGNGQYGSWISFATMADGGAGQGALERMRITSNGLVGVNTAAPDATLSVNGSADKPGGGSWGTFSDGRLKNLDGDFQAGLNEVLKLHPVRYRYKDGNGMGINDRDEHIGFVAQDVQKVIPEAVSQNSQGYLLVNNDPILWTMLNAIKEQQQQIARLNRKVSVLETALRTSARTRAHILKATLSAQAATGETFKP